MTDSRYVNLHGSKHMIYSALLDGLHRHCEESGNYWDIDTELIAKPSKDNSNTAICKAEICEYFYNPEGIKQVVRRTSGIGDASPENVGNKQIAKHLIRMAETRAKGRAARDFLNVHGEEFAGEYHHEPEQAVTEQPRGSERKTELAVVDGELDDDYDNEVDEDAEERKALLDELVTLAGQLGFNQKQISRRLETKWLEEDLIELEQAASRMRMAVQEKEKPLDERS